MNFSAFVARRYLFSPKSHRTINVISIISMVGVALATMSMVCVLSVFNGFHDLVASMFTAFDPQLELTACEGHTFPEDTAAVATVRKHPQVEVASAVLQNSALARFEGRQAMITLRGVDDNYSKAVDLKPILYGTGEFLLHADVIDYATPGIRLALMLNMNTNFSTPLEVYAPKPGERISLTDAAQSFNQGELNSSGNVFNVGQKEYDADHVICPLAFAQRILEQPARISSLAIRLRPTADVNKVKKELAKAVGLGFRVSDQFEQQEDIFRLMKMEKFMAYIFLAFILFIAAFNIISSLSMLILDKRRDISTFSHLGATLKDVRKVFLLEGRFIAMIGAVLGLGLGLLLCFLQQYYGILRLGEETGTFVVDAYPVSVYWGDIVLIFFTVVLVSWAVTSYPVRFLLRRLLDSKA